MVGTPSTGVYLLISADEPGCIHSYHHMIIYPVSLILLFLHFCAFFTGSESRRNNINLEFLLAAGVFERTGNGLELHWTLREGRRMAVNIVEQLATRPIRHDGICARRRLRVIWLLRRRNYSLNFLNDSLTACTSPRIFRFLLANGANSFRQDELYQALMAGNIRYADILLEYGRTRITEAQLEELMNDHVNEEVQEWIMDNNGNFYLVP